MFDQAILTNVIYFMTALAVVKSVLFGYAILFVRPKSLEKMTFAKRYRLTFLKEANEEKLFSPKEYRKLKLERFLWRSVLLLLTLRALIGFVLANLDYETRSKCNHPTPCEAKELQ